jgi:hypothetical protein
MTFATQAKALADARGDVAEALKLLPQSTLAADTLAQISGRATPMLAHMDRWKKPPRTCGTRPWRSAVWTFSNSRWPSRNPSKD